MTTPGTLVMLPITACGLCREEFVGPLPAGQAWFITHRNTVHPEVARRMNRLRQVDLAEKEETR